MSHAHVLAVAVVLIPASVAAQSDPSARARAECEARLGIPQIAGSGDPVREQQIAACVQQRLREQQGQRQQPRR